MIRYLLVSIITLLFGAWSVQAAEVKNLSSYQRGEKVHIEYELEGDSGERDAEVTVALQLDDRKIESNRLTLQGDFGKSVRCGKGKRIIWDVMKDFPDGLDSEIKWLVESPAKRQSAASAPSGSHGSLSVVDNTSIRDSSTGLTWMRNGKLSKSQVNKHGAIKIIDKMNADSVGGYDNWRLPNRAELQKIVDYAKRSGARNIASWLNSIGFVNVQAEEYWSGSQNRIEMRSKTDVIMDTMDMEKGYVREAESSDNKLYFLVVRN